jgi:hypothetical protein
MGTTMVTEQVIHVSLQMILMILEGSGQQSR